MKVHESTNPTAHDVRISKPRRRASKACVSCAQSKLRCEGHDPCRRCQRLDLRCRFLQQSYSQSSVREIVSSPGALTPSVSAESTGRDQSKDTSPDTHASEDNIVIADAPRGQAGSDQSIRHLQESAPIQPTTQLSFHQGSTNIGGTTLDPSLSVFPLTATKDFLDTFYPLDLSPHQEAGAGLEDLWDVFKMDVLDFGVLQPPEILAPPVNKDRLSPIYEGLSLGEEAYKQTVGCWVPTEGEKWLVNTADLSPALEAILSACVSSSPPQTNVRLQVSCRYRILSSILSVAGPTDHTRILSSFPSLEVLERLLSVELTAHGQETNSWLHVPSFNSESACTELLIGFVIAGALRTERAPFVKLGLALHELHRELLSQLHRHNYRKDRLLHPVRCLILMIEAGLRSGDFRRIEICESFLQMPITMIKRAGFLRLPNPEALAPRPNDSGAVLREKWLAWIDHESKKRLVLHLLMLSTESSMSFLTYPLLTHAEIHNSLPAAKSLWNAPSPEAWRTAYINTGFPPQSSLHTCVADLTQLLSLPTSVDPQYTALAVLAGLWLNTFQYKERLKALDTAPGRAHAKHMLSIQGLHQEAQESLEVFAAIHARALGQMDPSLVVLHERQLMYLHVSLEDLQLLGGKEGAVEARRVLPILQEWAGSRSCRDAMWHAGQILRAARQNGDTSLRSSTILSLYFASLVIWSYSILSRIQSPAHHTVDAAPSTRVDSSNEMKIILDGDYTPAIQQFVTLGFGRPCITHDHQGTDRVRHSNVEVTKQPEVTEAFWGVMNEKFSGDYQDCPSLVGNLMRLIRKLGQAAEAVQRHGGSA
ncbi:c2h2 type zinc finger domain [Pyrenophora seminiperda CCB06]|uniref:C2h2 type zinc finger domain n=1 Tax=Pyrenophora seminiperda CCB06 TaxID=1302712 RepID=A0A3M7MDD0_9PLEO|nr:c2h2 type zinc finger domain [Pyrenophora seminiperda CCB06]